ncbi:MAG: tetraacyldisaccharide 4'-kinase, partial [Phycisphaerae bacterium]|nr:tetraacyldisaccharide 4'-kinase [Phycisphaerae bacterium]
MSDWQNNIVAIMSGQRRGGFAAAGRAMLAIAEPLYAAIMILRNTMYERGWLATHQAGRAVISVGNLTTGGTGKTPIVAWIVHELRAMGYHPAVLLRGYKAVNGVSDEATLLRQLVAPSPVIARPDRVAAAANAVMNDPQIDCFVLDDGFQHRRLKRDCDVVLIDATRPFGFDHVLPRGLLREPIVG